MEIDEAIKQVVRPMRLDHKGNEKTMLWKDIKEFCDTLTAEQLEQDVLIWGDEKGGGAFAISILQDDMINPSGEGIEPKSFYAESEDEVDRATAEEEIIVIHKGKIIIDVDF